MLHALSWCYNSCAFEFCGKEVALAYAELPPHGRTRVHRTRADRTHGRTGLTTTEHKELARLRKENRELQTERNILRRAAAFFAKRRS